MAYIVKRPEIDTRHEIWADVKYLVLLGVIIIFALFILAAMSSSAKMAGDIFQMTLIVGVILFAYITNQYLVRFWRDMARANGWEYEEVGNPHALHSVMFRQGHSQSVTNVVTGVIDGRSFRFFLYQFKVGSGKSEHTYAYTVFSFKFNGTFPSIYLNRKFAGYSVSVGEEIPLPGEFEDKFILAAPRGYEVEALEIFTPDVLAKILDSKFNHDVEFVGQEIFMFVPGAIYRIGKFEEELNRALELEDLLDEKLDKFKFEKIGDRSPLL